MSAFRSTEDISNNMNTLHNCHDVAPYPCTSAAGGLHHPMVHEAGLQSPSLPYTGIPESYFNGRAGQAIDMGKVYSNTYMYICCQCGDGPKVYNVQPQCIICQHIACSSCREVK
ncbi:uncharacterized protein ACLA_011800 [Aspergillus clavatus NRRL 1]|uniref:Uncharacterized protein n=1 Tax=Aspergillus clavatus (strain ATCC 1007 / CBS 513.65 / DSM 816 / NCTC 3887 / NRRL 1 / QM 1276 / 107) TaxID=344612 RepID=A1CAI5_ASPCL|nr:uncharacterized protein ACLA_011800 [Aspergillus clavatus NRRL 1]EAW12753.1 conserved hypothetical protein [Aspergillus clavatus NRRL 1]